MLMAIKVKEVNIFPLVKIMVRQIEHEEEERYFKQPELFYYHLTLLLKQGRMGKNIVQDFIDRDFTHEGITWFAAELAKVDKAFNKECAYVRSRGEGQDPEPGRL